VKAPRSIVIAIANAVERRGGDMEDVRDLVTLWLQMHGDRPGSCRDAREGQDHLVCERRGLTANRPRRPNRRMREGRA